MKCRGKHHTTGNFPRSPLHFMLYRRKLITFGTVYCTAHSVQSTVHGYRSLYCTVQEKPETRKQCNISHLYSVFVRLGSLNRYWRWLKSAIQQGPLQYFVAYRAAAESQICKLLYNLRKFSHFRIFAHKQRFCCNSYLFIFYINVYSIYCNTIQRFSQLNKNGLFQVSPLQYVF